MDPIYITSPPEQYALQFKDRLLALGCSEEYSESARLDTLARAIQVESSWAANAILSGKGTNEHTS